MFQFKLKLAAIATAVALAVAATPNTTCAPKDHSCSPTPGSYSDCCPGTQCDTDGGYVCRSDLSNSFDLFKLNFQKTYHTPTEEAFRRQVFHDNMATISKRHPHSKQYGITSMSDVSTAEFKTMAGLRLSNKATSYQTYDTTTNDDTPPPTPIDWVAKGAVTGIKDQGICGSCWSFSATGSVEGQNFIQNNKLVSLSEQELMDCDTHELDHGCHGGEPHIAMEWVINNTKNGNGGQCSESVLPYSGVPDTSCPSTPEKKGIGKLTNWTRISTNETEIAISLANIGPLSAGINQIGMEHYRGGVVCPISDICDPNALNHAVLIVGWGIDDGQEYWKIKNSWGASYGEDGYFRICKGKGACGINRFVVGALLE